MAQNNDNANVIFPIIGGVVLIIIGIIILMFVNTSSGEWPTALGWGFLIFGGGSVLFAILRGRKNK